jgi:Holliday junction resolvase RusA-like endonuclease
MGMTETIRIMVPAVPVAQPRPRAVNFGKSARVHEVTHIKSADGERKPHPISAFKATVRLAAIAAYSGPPISAPCRMDVLFIFPRESSKVWKTKPMPRYPHDVKPDRDNLDKAVMDALRGTVLVDDSLVYDGRITKLRAAGDEQPHCEIVITTELDALLPSTEQEPTHA